MSFCFIHAKLSNKYIRICIYIYIYIYIYILYSASCHYCRALLQWLGSENRLEVFSQLYCTSIFIQISSSLFPKVDQLMQTDCKASAPQGQVIEIPVEEGCSD